MEDKIKTIVSEEFDADVISITPTSGGYSHPMYEVRITKEPFNFLIRFSNLSEKKERDLRKEVFVYEKLSKVGIRVPKILIFRKKDDNNEHDYAIIEKLKGKRLDTIWDFLSNEEKANISTKIGGLMKLIHSIKLEKFGKLNDSGEIEEEDKPFRFKTAGKQKTYSKFIRMLYKDSFKDIARLASYNHIDTNLISKILDFAIKNKKEIDYYGDPILIHGDLIPGHIFVEKVNTEYEITGLIDVEFAEPSCPEYDFIKLHRKGFFDDSNIKEALIKGYGKINEKAVLIFRTMRDIGFASVLLESGDNDFADKVLNEVEKRIDSI